MIALPFLCCERIRSLPQNPKTLPIHILTQYRTLAKARLERWKASPAQKLQPKHNAGIQGRCKFYKPQAHPTLNPKSQRARQTLNPKPQNLEAGLGCPQVNTDLPGGFAGIPAESTGPELLLVALVSDQY